MRSSDPKNAPYHTTKYLGLIIDDELCWKPHICDKLLKYIAIFYRMCNRLPMNVINNMLPVILQNISTRVSDKQKY